MQSPLAGLVYTAVAMSALILFQASADGSTGATVPGTESIKIVPIVTAGLDHPLFVTYAADASGRLFVAEQPGRIRIVEQGSLSNLPFLDIRDRVRFGGEQGLLGLAFHPDYRRNGRFYVNYNRKSDGATVLAEYRRETPATASRDEHVLMIVPQPYANHNGGMVAFGPDGNLYVARGDGGSRGDPNNRAQNPQDLLGKILRIDVDGGEPYAIPPDNPFVAGGGRPEIYALGLRNPWRFSFDPQNGALWVADVGQYKWEEIDLVTRGGNYGWRKMEGRHCYDPAVDCATPQLIGPVLEYTHEKGRCSIIGGYVYRGKALPGLVGIYVYGDFCSGEIFGHQGERNAASMSLDTLLIKSPFRISSFGVDEQNELYVIDHAGGLYRLQPSAQDHNFPASQ